MNPSWDTLERSRQARLERAAPWARGREVASSDVGELLHAVLEPGDKVCLEGNNQKQADFLSRALAETDPARVHDLHMIIPSVSRVEHLDLFERGIARKLDRLRQQREAAMRAATGRDLVPVKAALVEEELAKLGLRFHARGGGKGRHVLRDAYEAGHEAGDRFEYRPGITGQPGAETGGP